MFFFKGAGTISFPEPTFPYQRSGTKTSGIFQDSFQSRSQSLRYPYPAERAILGADQKDRSLWERDWTLFHCLKIWAWAVEPEICSAQNMADILTRSTSADVVFAVLQPTRSSVLAKSQLMKIKWKGQTVKCDGFAGKSCRNCYTCQAVFPAYKGLVHKISYRGWSLSQIQKWRQSERKSVCYRATGDKPWKTRWYWKHIDKANWGQAVTWLLRDNKKITESSLRKTAKNEIEAGKSF